MKRPGSSDSFKDLHDGMEEVEYLEEEDDLCGNNGPSSGLGEKKRRLGAEQVRALEKNFEVENKLDPERKVRLAQDLGLQPRQVAVWFQNRRARWKTKQLERDFGALKARHDALKIDCDALRRDKEALLAEVEELKTKMADSGIVASDSEFKAAEEVIRASDSDSSAVFNDEASPYACLMGFNSHCSNSLSFPNKDDYKDCCYMGVEFMARDELCSSLFSEEQAPNLHWYSRTDGTKLLE